MHCGQSDDQVEFSNIGANDCTRDAPHVRTGGHAGTTVLASNLTYRGDLAQLIEKRGSAMSMSFASSTGFPLDVAQIRA
jgi:hypothetical protein